LTDWRKGIVGFRYLKNVESTHELADFVEAASKVYGFDLQYVAALGYSNGANIAASENFQSAQCSS
jgi:predicted esterase